jgi:phosphatidate cytidylyltransferase
VNDFVRRVAFAVVAIPAVAGIVWLGGLALAVLLAVVAALCAHEFFGLATATGVRGFRVAGVAIAALIPFVVYTNHAGLTLVPPAAALALVFLAVFAAAVWLRFGERPLAAVGVTLFAIVYAGVMPVFGYAIRHHPYAISAAAGTALLGLPVLLTWATDTGGYAFGKWLGKRKLIPRISPGKTWAGAVGGTLLAVAVAWAYVEFVLDPVGHLRMSTTRVVVFGAAISVVAQVGDLAESLLKRDAGVKDSSHLIPGHGGALDRVDSLLFVLPVSWVLLSEMLMVAP